jgi:hypothetical protein
MKGHLQCGGVLVWTFFMCVGGGVCADVLIQIEVLEVRHELRSELMLQEQFSRDGQALRVELQKRKSEGGVHLLNLAVIRSQLTRKNSMESRWRYQYPAERDIGDGLGNFPAAVQSIEDGIFEPVSPESMMSGVLPDWDVVWMGEELSSEIDYQGLGVFSLSFDFEQSKLISKDVFIRWGSPSGVKHEITMPRIGVMKVDQNLLVAEGKYTLASVMNSDDRSEYCVMVFVRCDTLK